MSLNTATITIDLPEVFVDTDDGCGQATLGYGYAGDLESFKVSGVELYGLLDNFQRSSIQRLLNAHLAELPFESQYDHEYDPMHRQNVMWGRFS